MSEKTKLGPICDEYMNLKKPGVLEACAEAVRPIINDALSGRTIEEAEADKDKILSEYYQGFIGDGAPFDGEDVRQMKKDRLKRKGGGGHTGDRYKDQRLVALKAFLKVDQRGGTTAEAKAEAREAIKERWPHGDHERSIQDWLKQIQFLTDIKQSPRGRSKK